MTGPRLADPVLPLQTMNAHCMAVRIAAANAANPVQLTPEALTTMINMAAVVKSDLREMYRACRGDASLEARLETTAKALERVVYGLKAKRGDQ